MNYCKFVFLLGSVTLVALGIHAAENTQAKSNSVLPLSFENAEAWNITIEKVLPLTRSFRAAFSSDFRDIIHVENIGEFGSPRLLLSIRSLEKWELKKQIELPAGADLYGCFAYSPDGSKVAYGPVSLRRSSYKPIILFIDLATSTITPVDLKQALPAGDSIFDSYLTWPNPTNVYLGGHLGISGEACMKVNLDTLEVQSLPTEFAKGQQRPSTPRKLSTDRQRVSTQKNCVLEDVSGSNLTVSSRRGAYRQVLNYDLKGPDDMRVEIKVVWSPDLRYVLFENPAALVYLGLRPTPELDFELTGIEALLTDSKRQQLKKALAEGKRVGASIYDRRINPLTDRTIGPDDEKLRGHGLLTEISPRFKFKLTFEVQPISASNIVSMFRVVTEAGMPRDAEFEWNWGNQVWGELIKVGDPGGSGLGAALQSESVPPPPNLIQIGSEIQKNPAWPIIQRAAEAVGGSENIFRASTTRVRAKAKTWIAGQGFVQNEVVFYTKYPERLRQEASYQLKSGNLNQVFTYHEGNVRGLKNGKPFSVSVSAKESLKREAFVQKVESLRALLEDKYRVRLNDDATVNGKRFSSISVFSADDLSITLLFDPDTGLLIRRRFERMDQNGKTVNAEVVYSNYTAWDGIKIPGRVEGYENGQLRYESDVQEMTVIPDILDAYFSDPSLSMPDFSLPR